VKLRSGASRMVEALQHAGVRCVFGLPGTQTIELFEALRQAKVRTIVATSELNAAFMAGGWARVTGEPGVLITISGPGFTWALTGIAEARLDSVPLVHITGSPSADPIPRLFRQQELPQTELARPLYKAIIDADSYVDIAEAIAEAMHCARAGEPGPVLVQVTSMALQLERTLPGVLPAPPIRDNKSPDVINAVVARVREARRPVFFVGPGAIHSAEPLRKLIEHLDAPVVTSPSARGLISEIHPLNLGFDAFAGSIPDLNEFLGSADLVVAIGCKMGHSDTSGFELQLARDRLIHVDASAEAVAANYPASLAAVGKASEVISALLAAGLPRTQWTDLELEEWRGRLFKRAHGVEPRVGGTPTGDAAAFFTALRHAMSNDAVLVLDSGLHQVLARSYFSVRTPHGMLMPTDLQSMGFGIPTAIGARLALPRQRVVALVGDGGFAMTALELLSAARENVSITVIVFADGAFGQIRLQQLGNYGTTHAVSLRNPDFALLAESVGAHHESVDEDGDIEGCVRDALKRDGVTVIEVSVRDSLPIRRVAATARAKKAARSTSWVRALLLMARVLIKK
jgi:acetolactate synthase-1/2/3 large subunit